MKKAVWGGAVAVAAAVSLAVFVFPNVLTPRNESLIGACRALPTGAGVGDITVDSKRGVAYLAYLDRTPKPEGRPPNGTVMLVDLNAKEPRIRAALVTDPPDFRPIALSLYAPVQGARRLFVVDSGTSPASVQVFEQSAAGAFALVATIRDPLLDNATAIVAVGPDEFYATTDADWLDPATSGRVSRWVQIVFASAHGSAGAVVFHDGQRMRQVTNGLTMPVGIDVSPDGGTLYVAALSEKRIQVFARDLMTGELKAQESIELASLPHHLHTDAVGNVWVAAHPQPVAALKSIEGMAAQAPTQIVKLSPSASGDRAYHGPLSKRWERVVRRGGCSDDSRPPDRRILDRSQASAMRRRPVTDLR